MTPSNTYALATALAEIPADRRWEMLRTIDSRGYGFTCRIYRARDARLIAGAGKGPDGATAVRRALEQLKECGL